MQLCGGLFVVFPADEDTSKCPSGGLCHRLPAHCIQCDYHLKCTYGKPTLFTCRPKKGVHCIVSNIVKYSCL